MSICVKLVPDDIQRTMELPRFSPERPQIEAVSLWNGILETFPGISREQRLNVFFKNQENGIFILVLRLPCGSEKMREDRIALESFIDKKTMRVHLKVQRIIETVAMSLSSDSCFSQDHLMTRANKTQTFELENEFDEKTRKRRNKERRIGFIIKKVKEWRSLYSEDCKNSSKINLYDAATKVGISKKSLDDYWMQLK